MTHLSETYIKLFEYDSVNDHSKEDNNWCDDVHFVEFETWSASPQKHV